MKIGVPKEVKSHEYRVALTPAGTHELVWDGMTDRGTAAAAGMYFVSARVDGRAMSKRVILVR